jgi:hypothetical protein
MWSAGGARRRLARNRTPAAPRSKFPAQIDIVTHLRPGQITDDIQRRSEAAWFRCPTGQIIMRGDCCSSEHPPWCSRVSRCPFCDMQAEYYGLGGADFRYSSPRKTGIDRGASIVFRDNPNWPREPTETKTPRKSSTDRPSRSRIKALSRSRRRLNSVSECIFSRTTRSFRT